MFTSSRLAIATSIFALTIMYGCAGQKQVEAPDSIPAMYVDADGTHESMQRDTLRNAFPHLKMSDGRISLNDRCPVRKVPLNRRLPALFVNGAPIGFC